MSLRYLTIGSLFAVALIFSAIATNPAAAFARGLGRFFPHGANPNHVGPVFMLAAPLFLFAIIRWPRTFWKVVFIAALAATIGMAVMTASRQTIVVMAGVCMPLALYLTRRPVATIVAGGVLLAGVMFVLSTSPEITYERLLTLETGRAGLVRPYTEIVQNRPVFGLMGTSGLSAIQADDVGQHTHNAYVDMLYLGGLSYALPMLALFAAGLFSAWRVFRIRKWLWFDPLMLSMLAAFYGMMLLHGLVGVFITYPTHAWAFFFVFLCCFFITTATQARAVLAQPNYEDPAQEYENEAMDYPVAATFTR